MGRKITRKGLERKAIKARQAQRAHRAGRFYAQMGWSKLDAGEQIRCLELVELGIVKRDGNRIRYTGEETPTLQDALGF